MSGNSTLQLKETWVEFDALDFEEAMFFGERGGAGRLPFFPLLTAP